MPFRAIERTAAAQSDYRINLQRRNDFRSRFNHARVGIDLEVVKAKDLYAGPLQRIDGFIDVPGRNQTMIRDEQRTLEVQLARQLAETFDCAGAKDHASTRLKIETLQVALLLRRSPTQRRKALPRF